MEEYKGIYEKQGIKRTEGLVFNEEYKKQRNMSLCFQKAEMHYFRPIPVPVPFYDASGGPFNTVPVDCWVFLTDSDGNTGQAPCGPLMKERLLPLLLNGETHTYEEWYQKCYWAIRNFGFSGETANELGRLDLCLHDLMAKRAGMPLHRLLGASRDWAAVYASACGTNLTLEESVRELEQFLDQGYTTFKIKVAGDYGGHLDKDLEKIRVTRETIGPDKALALDVNQIWTAEEAMRFYDMFEKYDIAWFEEPVHSHDFRQLAILTKECPIPIGMGESVKNYFMLEEYVHCGVGQLQPIPTNLCSVTDWLKGRKLAYDHGIAFTSGGVSQLTASYIASGREEDMVEYLTPIMAPLNLFLKKRPEEKDGKFILDTEPGAAVEPDIELFRKAGYLECTEYLNAPVQGNTE